MMTPDEKAELTRLTKRLNEGAKHFAKLTKILAVLTDWQRDLYCGDYAMQRIQNIMLDKE